MHCQISDEPVLCLVTIHWFAHFQAIVLALVASEVFSYVHMILCFMNLSHRWQRTGGLVAHFTGTSLAQFKTLQTKPTPVQLRYVRLTCINRRCSSTVVLWLSFIFEKRYLVRCCMGIISKMGLFFPESKRTVANILDWNIEQERNMFLLYRHKPFLFASAYDIPAAVGSVLDLLGAGAGWQATKYISLLIGTGLTIYNYETVLELIGIWSLILTVAIRSIK